jgi:hypothetical protein
MRTEKMKIHEPAMTFKDDEAKTIWEKGLATNTACYRFASSWATLMEKNLTDQKDAARLMGGEEFAKVAKPKEASHEADNEGITGFIYGCAVTILSQTWVHGEELRQWHNTEHQIRSEGEAANKNGGVLNPALLNMGKGK